MALSEAYGGDWQDVPLPVWQQLKDIAHQYPSKLALASLHQPADLYGLKSLSDDHLQWSYSQLESTSQNLSHSLQAHGIASGSCIVTILDNGVEFPLTFWAAHRLGCPFVPLNPRNLTNQVEARHMLAIADAAVVIVGSPVIATAFDSLAYKGDGKLLKIIASDDPPSGWIAFSSLLGAVEQNDGNVSTLEEEPASKISDGPVTILFTSGTTSLPKGCPHTNQTLNAFMKNLSLGGCSTNDAFCSVLPNNHAMGYFYVLHFFCQGGAVVYPSPTFDSEKMAKALTVHNCTHACLVPTALHSLIEYVQNEGLRYPALQDVCLAGASITPHNLRQVVATLGSRAVSTGFGMTEGSPIWLAATPDPESLIAGDDTISGSAAPGAHIKICASNSTIPLPRGESGEIHESGPGVIQGYMGNNVGIESFYADEGRTWFKTGDRAVMHPDGRVSIVGRYKDMIIRGGENIAPAAIEAVLNQFPGVEAQVVAAKDSIAGEVPVAIIRKLPAGDDPRELLSTAVRASMGMLHVPDEIMTLETLGLDDYPRTMSGKVQKATLRNLVAAFRKHLNSDSTQLDHNSKSKSIEQTVLQVWWRATGISPGNLVWKLRLPISRTQSRLCESGTCIGKSLISGLQVKLGRSRRDSGYQTTDASRPPSLEDLQLVVGPENDAASFKDLASSSLQSSGFDFEKDVDAVIPASDFTNVLIRTNIMDSWNFGIAIVADGSTLASLQQALIAALRQSPLWPSFYVRGADGSPFYITLKPQQKIYDQCLTVCGSVATLADLQQKAISYPHAKHATYPGMLFHALLFHVEELNSAAFVMYLHHAVHDASSMRLFLEDLNQSLRAPTQDLRPHVPFKTWSDIYHSLRDSPRATIEVEWHVKRLQDIHLHRKALFPRANIPRKAITSSPDGWDYGFDAPQLLNLKSRHPRITASVVLKAAMALVNITRTQHTHALFSNFEAARSSLPFWPGTLRHLPAGEGANLADLDASDVAGPTMNAATNLIPVDRSETAIAFLTRLQDDQAELTKRSHAPWRRIMSALDALHPGEKAGDMLPETLQTQFLTWIPGFLGDYEKLRVVQIGIRAVLGLVFVAGLGGPKATTYMISMRWDVANYSQAEVEGFVKDVEKAIVWLLEEGNWERHVGGFLDGI